MLGFREFRDGLLFIDTATVEFRQAFTRITGTPLRQPKPL
jgi:hypothetical protein